MQRTIYWVALTLVVVGAVNWGLVGIAQFDLVAALFGGTSAALARVVYTLVGIAGLVLAATAANTARSDTRVMRPMGA